ncbi:hypothetical protein DFH06DRAFT_1123398 [Mycena polygramma]|nr:hypothetical protein DFH06DRAFT_1123398 [Mycena polygramma]
MFELAISNVSKPLPLGCQTLTMFRECMGVNNMENAHLVAAPPEARIEMDKVLGQWKVKHFTYSLHRWEPPKEPVPLLHGIVITRHADLPSSTQSSSSPPVLPMLVGRWGKEIKMCSPAHHIIKFRGLKAAKLNFRIQVDGKRLQFQDMTLHIDIEDKSLEVHLALPNWSGPPTFAGQFAFCDGTTLYICSLTAFVAFMESTPFCKPKSDFAGLYHTLKDTVMSVTLAALVAFPTDSPELNNIAFKDLPPGKIKPLIKLTTRATRANPGKPQPSRSLSHDADPNDGPNTHRRMTGQSPYDRPSSSARQYIGATSSPYSSSDNHRVVPSFPSPSQVASHGGNMIHAETHTNSYAGPFYGYPSGAMASPPAFAGSHPPQFEGHSYQIPNETRAHPSSTTQFATSPAGYVTYEPLPQSYWLGTGSVTHNRSKSGFPSQSASVNHDGYYWSPQQHSNAKHQNCDTQYQK